MNDEISPQNMISLMNGYEDDLNLLEESRDTLYWKSKTALIRGQVYYSLERNNETLNEMEICIEMAEKSMTYGEYSEGWRLQADAGSYVMLIKGVANIIANSGKMQNMAKKSLLLDPDNARSSLIIAQALINAPPLFGGNKKKGSEILERLNNRNDIKNEDRYYIMLALCEAYKALNRKDDAIRTYRNLQRIYRGSTYVQSLLNELL
jgi:tetratricopeptide (TPR) repeat protein